MNYSTFKSQAERADREANNRTHFFSSLFSLPVAYAAHRSRMSPNFVTFLFLVAGVSSSVSLYFGAPVVSYLFWRLHLILDMADGDIARATRNFSKSAMGFDRTNHIVINTLFIFVACDSVSASIFVAPLVISFYMSYFFSRNYYSEKQETRSFSMSKNLLKSALGFEGFVLVSCVIHQYFDNSTQLFAVLFYTLCFSAMYFQKLMIFQKSNADAEGMDE